MPGNYDEVVGDNKDQFLKECSDQYKPVVCIDVRSGSIIITLGGDEADVEATKTSMKADGVELAGFNIGGEESKEDNSAMGVIIVLVVGGLCFVVILGAILSFSYKWQEQQEKKQQHETNMLEMHQNVEEKKKEEEEAGDTGIDSTAPEEGNDGLQVERNELTDSDDSFGEPAERQAGNDQAV